jgi:hypothetical protein
MSKYSNNPHLTPYYAPKPPGYYYGQTNNNQEINRALIGPGYGHEDDDEDEEEDEEEEEEEEEEKEEEMDVAEEQQHHLKVQALQLDESNKVSFIRQINALNKNPMYGKATREEINTHKLDYDNLLKYYNDPERKELYSSSTKAAKIVLKMNIVHGNLLGGSRKTKKIPKGQKKSKKGGRKSKKSRSTKRRRY